MEAMFHPVTVTSDDCDGLWNLWWPNNKLSEKPRDYRMDDHFFGGVCSPSCSSYVLRRTTEDHRCKFDSKFIEIVNNNFYFDDCLKSVSTEGEAIHQCNYLCHLLSIGGFRLRKWISICRNVLRCVPQKEQAKELKSLDLENEMLPSEIALGLQWNVEQDQSSFKMTDKDNRLLSMVNSVCDPLEFVLVAKMILQQFCRMKVKYVLLMTVVVFIALSCCISVALLLWKLWLSLVFSC